MNRLLRAGFLASLISVALFQSVAEVRGGQLVTSQNGKGLSVSKGITLNSTPTILSQSTSSIISGKSAVVTSSAKKSSVVLGNGQSTTGSLSVIAKGTGVFDSAKKTSSIFDLGKASPILIGKGGQSLVTSDLYCKPICQPYGANWCGWWGSCNSPWLACYPCYNSWNCTSWWGACQPSACGWFGGWCGTVIVQPIVITTPVVKKQLSFSSVVGGLDTATEQLQEQTKRFLKIKNESGEKLQVFVQYLARTEDGDSVWVPGEAASDKALTLTVDAGQELFVENNSKRVASSVVRIWAVAEKGAFLEFRGKDLRLVPEQNQNGEYVYMANEIKTFTFAFPPLATTQAAAIDASVKSGSIGSQASAGK